MSSVVGGGVGQFGQGEDAPDGLVDGRLIQLTVVHRVDDLCVGGAVAAGHLQVHAGPERFPLGR